jgi:hypothetical protein
VNVPIYSNMKPLSHYIGWREIEEIVDGHGIGLFMSNMIPGDQALVTSWYVRLTRAITRFPFAAEFQSFAPMGQEEVFGILSDDHQRYITELAVALGLRGLAYYAFVERDDAYGAPISPLGKVRPRLEQVKEGIKMARAVRPDRQLCALGLLWSYDHHRLRAAERFTGWDTLYHCWIGMNMPQELPAWWSAFSTLHEEDIDFAIMPMGEATRAERLVYAGPDQVRLEEWEKVTEAVEAGATLYAVATPREDLHGVGDGVEALNDRLRATGRLVTWDAGPLDGFLAAAAPETPVKSGTRGVWTTAYEADGTVWVFVANTTVAPAVTEIAFGSEIVDGSGDTRAIDVVSEERWEISEGGKLKIEVGPKRVRMLAVEQTS